MKKWIFAIVFASFGASAFAGFVDERKPAGGAPAGAAAASPAEASSVAGARALAVAPAAAQAPSAPVVQFAVLSTDKTVRETLVRWAGLAGWLHQPDHWAVSEDYSVGGTAGADVFGSDFRGAVRTLIASTDLTSRPAQPCFYSNNVVRVIPRAGICDPTAQ